MNRAIARHRLKPVVDSLFPLAKSREEFLRMEKGRHFGKIAVEI